MKCFLGRLLGAKHIPSINDTPGLYPTLVMIVIPKSKSKSDLYNCDIFHTEFAIYTVLYRESSGILWGNFGGDFHP